MLLKNTVMLKVAFIPPPSKKGKFGLLFKTPRTGSLRQNF